LRRLHGPETDENPALQRTIDVGSIVNAVAYLEIQGVPHVLSGSDDGVLRLWQLATGHCVREFKGHTRSVSAVAVTAAGQALSASTDKALRLWDLPSGQCLRVLAGHTDSVNAVAVTATGQVLSGSGDRTVRLWDPTGQSVAVFPCEAPVLSLAVTADPIPIVVAGLADGQVQFFRLEPG
jgi:WD40 repeat protein